MKRDRLWIPGMPLGAVGNAMGGAAGPPSFGPYRDMLLVLAAGNPISHWTLSEAAGDFVDIFAGHNLAVSGAPTRGVPGPLGGGQDLGAVHWNGVGNYASHPDHIDFDLGDGPFTLITFTNRLIVVGGWEVMLSKGTNGYGLGISPPADTNSFSFLKDNIAQIVRVPGYGAGGGWTWWVASRIAVGAGNSIVYQNGVAGGGYTGGANVINDTASALQVGRDEVGDPPYAGQQAELTIIKGVALTAGDVAALNAVR